MSLKQPASIGAVHGICQYALVSISLGDMYIY